MQRAHNAPKRDSAFTQKLPPKPSVYVNASPAVGMGCFALFLQLLCKIKRLADCALPSLHHMEPVISVLTI